MTLQPAVAAVQQGNGIAQQEVTVRLSQSNPAAEAEAREILRTIHNTIIVFRDDRWDGLVRARNRLVRTTLYTGVFTFVLLGVTIVVGAPLAAIEAAALFSLVGVIFGGLIIRLYLDSTNDSAVEDYGLATVRLVQTSLLSGLAAIGGVVLTGAFPTDGQSATNQWC